MTAVSSPVTDSPDDSREVRLADVLDTLLQHVGIVMGVFLIVLAIGVAYSILATPIYRADALIQVEQRKSGTLSGVQEIADVFGTSSSPVSGEIAIIGSREVILKAVAATRADVSVVPLRFPVIGSWLARRYNGNKPASPWFGMAKYAWGGERIRIDNFQLPEEVYGQRFYLVAKANGYVLTTADNKVLAEGRVGSSVDFLVNGQSASIYVAELLARPETHFILVREAPISSYRRIRAGLTIEEAGRQSSVIRVSYSHPNVAFAQNLVNAIAKAYLTQNVERRSAEADQSLKFLEEQLPIIKKNVDRAEEALNNYRTKTNTVSVEKSIDSLLQQSVDAERERLQLELKRDELRQIYRAEHPELKAIESKISAINERSRTVNNQVSRLPAAQRDLLRLQRDVEVANQLYIALLNNAQQLRVAKAGTVGNVRVIDFALRDPVPVAPKKPAIVGASALLGLLLGVATAFLVRSLRPTMRDVAEVERATGLVSYASVPESPAQAKLASAKRGRKGQAAIVDGRNQLLAALAPEDIAIESLRSLRTGLTFASLGARDKNIVITGATAALGKSFVSANLSVLLANAGKRVLLIETDMRRPQLAAYFGQRAKVGLSNVLAGVSSLEDALVHDAGGIQGLDVIFSGTIPPNPGELLLGDAFVGLVADAQGRYDHIILDSAPILPVGDTLAVGRVASMVFLVVRAEVSTAKEVNDAVRKLEAAGISVKGFIFNGVKRRRIGYGYAYRYYYRYGSST